MKRNIIITLVIILGIIVLMFIGDVITIGEKLARVTHLWWVEYAFYGVILLAFLWLVIRPIVKLHRTPELPSLNHEGVNNVVELKKFGARLAENCNYIADEKLRVDHQLQLRNDVQQWHDEQNLSLVVDREVQLRLHGDAALGAYLPRSGGNQTRPDSLWSGRDPWIWAGAVRRSPAQSARTAAPRFCRI